jgi:ribosomal protein S18 acetylase RimI-like enzyme
MHDLQCACIPASWRVVVYALLVKPPPSDPNVVAQRREIALMEQLQKTVLQAVRRVTYVPMAGRVLSPQLGWLQGHATAHVGLQLEVLIQQAARIGHPLIVIYCDLATFFPSLDRGLLMEHELLAGLPDDVVNLAAAIYGGAVRASGGEAHCCPREGVSCRYDSSGGLGDAFANDMGALMGCVLSPDRAKLFVNSVVAAIHISVRGVRLWGCAPRTQGEAWARLAQFLFADDLAAAFTCPHEARLAWWLLRAWSTIMGQKLGVKKKLKTVVTAVQYDESGKPIAAEDPRLRMEDGTLLPFMTFDELYKHLGIERRVDARRGAVTTRVRAKVAGAMVRVKQMRYVSMKEFSEVCEALIGGVVAFSYSSTYLCWSEAEAIEIQFRAAFNSRFGRAASTARLPLYVARGARPRLRTHVWAIALGALYASVTECLSERGDTQQRRAARSAVALALTRWGCRGDPSRWCWAHLASALEYSLEYAVVRYLGDAWMLAALLATADAATGEVDSSGPTSRWRWLQAAGDRGPLRADAPHFAPPRSCMVFEPERTGGIGAAPAGALLEAGLTAVGHFCVVGDGGAPRWIASLEEAVAVHGARLASTGASAQWAAAMATLEGKAAPVEPERGLSLRAGVVSAREVGETRRRAAQLLRGVQGRDQLLEALVAERDALRSRSASQQSADGDAPNRATEPTVAEAPPAPTVIGVIGVEMLEEHPQVPGASVLWIDELARAPPQEGVGVRGVGSRLLYEALAGFEARLGALPDVVQLHVDVGNVGAIRWYVGRGFGLVRGQPAAKALEAHERAVIPAAPVDAQPVHHVELDEGGGTDEGASRRSSRLDPQKGKPLAYCLQTGGAALWRRLSGSAAVLECMFDDCVQQFTREELIASPSTWGGVKQLVDDAHDASSRAVGEGGSGKRWHEVLPDSGGDFFLYVGDDGDDVADEEAAEQEGATDWPAALRAAVGLKEDATATESGEWDAGTGGYIDLARGPRLFFSMARAVDPFGGEARWMQREDVCSETGWRIGWEEASARALEGISVDGTGYLAFTSSGGRIGEAEARSRGPGVEAAWRARVALGDVPVVDGPVVKPTRRRGGQEGGGAGETADDGAGGGADGAAAAPDPATAAARGGASSGGAPAANAAVTDEEEEGMDADILLDQQMLEAGPPLPDEEEEGEDEPPKPATAASPTETPPSDGPFVNVQAAHASLVELADWVARVGAEAVFTLDGTRQTVSVPSESGDVERQVAAWAAVRHDGHVLSGTLPGGYRDNYMAEMAAQLAVARESGVRRVVIVFDATSPPEVLRRFAWACPRRRQRVYRRDWLDDWLRRLLAGFDVVVLLWQTSHVGAPINEWADLEADRAVAAAEGLPILLEPSYASVDVEIEGQLLRGGLRAYALRGVMVSVVERLRASCGSTQVVEECDLELHRLPPRLDDLAQTVLAGRCQVGDPRRYCGQFALRMVKALGCPFGCGCGFTWHEAAFVCQGSPMLDARRRWLAAVRAAEERLALHASHARWVELRRRLVVSLEGGGALPAGLRALEHGSPAEIGMRRLVGGAVLRSAHQATNSSYGVLRRVTRAVRDGLELQTVARSATAEFETQLRKEISRLGRARPYARLWRMAVLHGGPRRAAALRAAAEARDESEDELARLERRLPAALAGRGNWGIEFLERWCGLGARMVEEQRRARSFRSLSAACAMREWRWLAMLRRWRWRAADLLWGGLGLVEDPVSGARRRSWRVAWSSGTAAPQAHGIRVGVSPGGEEAGLDERAGHARGWWRWGGGRRRLEWLRRWETDEGREADSRGRWRVERLIQVERPAVRRGRQLDVQVGWAGVDVAADGAAWGAGWVPVTCLTGDLKRLARAMEADRYPVRQSEPPREGARKCARLRVLPTVPEGEVASGEARGLPDGLEGQLPQAAAQGAAAVDTEASGWGAVLAMTDIEGAGTGASAAGDDGGWDDWAGGWDGGDGGAAEMEEGGL